MEEDNRMNVLAPEVAKVDELDKNNLRVVLELCLELFLSLVNNSQQT